MDSPTGPLEATQHNTEIYENLRHWERKSLLREEYARFYREIAAALTDAPVGPVLECGSGIGNLKSVLPHAITSDLFANPWLDRQENTYALSYPDRSLSGVVLFDVFHHLQYPGWALKELHRVLKPGGKVIIFEPAMGLFGRLALGLFHHEPLGLSHTIIWEPTEPMAPESLSYYAAQGNAWRVFREPAYNEKLAGWASVSVGYYPAALWLMTGGFRGPSLCPSFLVRTARFLDRLLTRACPQFLASRMLVTLTKR